MSTAKDVSSLNLGFWLIFISEVGYEYHDPTNIIIAGIEPLILYTGYLIESQCQCYSSQSEGTSV